MNKRKVMITGTSTGLGLAFARRCLARDDMVYGLSRSGCPLEHQDLVDLEFDLADLSNIDAALGVLLEGVTHLDLLILNAGILGEIQPMAELEMDRLSEVMDINVWSNKAILDSLHARGIQVDQVIAISSGAAVNGNKGWGAYSLSKATLNMLIKLYAAEQLDTHFIALAPGLIDTGMQNYLCNPDKVDPIEFPSVKKLRAARCTEAMPKPVIAARNMLAVFDQLREAHPSGAFVDMRSL